MDGGLSLAALNFDTGLSGVDKFAALAERKTAPTHDVDGSGFTAALIEAGNTLVEKTSQAEATAIAGVKGEATAYEVASTMIEAEQALKMSIAVRDKIVSAYLEISRMQI